MHGVLITGGTGTFGRAFTRHLLDSPRNIERIVILSRDEYKQATMERELSTHHNFRKLNFFVGDVRDESRIDMALHGINYVVHAAAMKRIEKCERDPIEAIETNINGTINVIRAVLRQPKMVNMVGLSTDKACNPVNLYGATKLAAEKLLAAANNLAGGRIRFSAVRYGNVWGSRGSVVDIWREAIAAGWAVQVTDPNATRFWMTIDDAVTQVEKQLYSLDPAQLCIPVIRKAYRLGDLLRAMAITPHQQGCIVGLSRFEKLHEEIAPGITSDKAERMTIEELKEELAKL